MGFLEALAEAGWKMIPGFPQYAVNSQGQIWDFKNKCYRKTNLNKVSKYEIVNLKDPDKERSRRRGNCYYPVNVHSLMGVTWVKRKKGTHHINHKNKVRHDNRACNLEWVSMGDNTFHANTTDKYGITYAEDIFFEIWRRFDENISKTAISKKIGININAVGYIIKNKKLIIEKHRLENVADRIYLREDLTKQKNLYQLPGFAV